MTSPARPDAAKEKNSSDWWGRFLSARMGLIHAWIDEGRTPGEIADTLSMDPEQVLLISMTPYFDHTFGELPE
jgi:hypothetical protein